MTIVAAADGSALGNPGPAGWAWYVDDTCWAAGGWPHGTNNMGELMAVLDLLRQSAHLDDELVIFCDSTYVINTVTKWMAGWKRKGWRKGDGKPVMNLELVQAIDAAIAGRRVRFEWVKGHAGHELNEAADRLANGAASTYQRGGVPDAGPGFGAAASAAVSEASVSADSCGPAPRASRAVIPSAAATLFDEQEAAADPRDDGPSDEEQVIGLERALLTTEVRTDPEALDRLLHPQWSEIGSSGRVMERESTLTRLGPTDADLEVLEVARLAPDIILLVWRATGDAGSRLRSSVWQRTDGRWRQRFHQGTVEPSSL